MKRMKNNKHQHVILRFSTIVDVDISSDSLYHCQSHPISLLGASYHLLGHTLYATGVFYGYDMPRKAELPDCDRNWIQCRGLSPPSKKTVPNLTSERLFRGKGATDNENS